MNNNFNTFASNVCCEISQRMPEAHVELKTVTKNNGVKLTGIAIRFKDEFVTPTIYLEQFFEKSDGDINENLIDTIIEVANKNRVKSVDFSFFKDYETVKHGLKVKLINTETNKELLTQVPHKSFLDLSIVTYYEMDETSQFGTATIRIRNGLLEQWDVSESQVISDAINNMFSNEKCVIRNMNEMIKEMTGMDAPEMPLFVAQSGMLFGAKAMLYSKDIMCFAKSIESDLYIIPSSIHEIILVPSSLGMKPDDITDMIQDINGTEVDTEDILSNHVYFFSMDTGYRF